MAAPMATTSSGIDAFMAFLAKNVLDQLLDPRHTGHTADQHDFVDVRRLVAGVAERGHDRLAAAVNQMLDHLLELRPSDRQLQVFRPGRVGRDERQVDVGRRLQ